MANVPEGLRYSNTHEWVKVEGNVAVIGITDFAQGELSDIVMVELPQPGREVKAGESIGVIEAVKAVSDLYSPVSGKIVEVNSALSANPDTINKDSYDAGWIVKLELADASEADKLMDAQAYGQFILTAGH